MNKSITWVESHETSDRYWSLKGSGFTIVNLPNAYELSYDETFEGITMLTTHRSIHLEVLKNKANKILTELSNEPLYTSKIS
jgi:hypothetical protein